MNRVSSLPLRASFGAFVAILLLSVVSLAQTVQQPVAVSDVKIKNFGQMDERFYRGGQPKKDDYKTLAALGIKTVIDLREETEEYEKPAVEALGMRYVNIPMIAKKYPKEDQVAEFMKLVNDPETGKFYVHCAGGRHRTGVMGAVYRFTKYGWNFEKVYAEMKNYDFYTRWGHGYFKKFVEDYWQRTQATNATRDAAAGATSGGHR